MHELGITEELLSLTLRHAEQAHATRVVRLNLVIGEFSSVVDDSIQFYWDMMAGDTIAADAELSFQRVPGTLRCADCEATFSYTGFEGVCPECGGVRVGIADGDQFQLESIEVEGVDENGSHQAG